MSELPGFVSLVGNFLSCGKVVTKPNRRFALGDGHALPHKKAGKTARGLLSLIFDDLVSVFAECVADFAAGICRCENDSFKLAKSPVGLRTAAKNR